MVLGQDGGGCGGGGLAGGGGAEEVRWVEGERVEGELVGEGQSCQGRVGQQSLLLRGEG